MDYQKVKHWHLKLCTQIIQLAMPLQLKFTKPAYENKQKAQEIAIMNTSFTIT